MNDKIFLLHCNIVYDLDKNNEAIFIQESIDDTIQHEKDRNLYTLLLDAKELSVIVENIETSILTYLSYKKDEYNNLNENLFEGIRTLQTKAYCTDDIETLTSIKQKIREKYELIIRDDEYSMYDHLKNLLIEEYIRLIIIRKILKHTNDKFMKTDENDDMIENILSMYNRKEFDVNNLIDLLLSRSSDLSGDISCLYNSIVKMNEAKRSFISIVIVNGEYIVDKYLQNQINLYMSNQRSGCLSMSIFTQGELLSEWYYNEPLLDTHDVFRLMLKK